MSLNRTHLNKSHNKHKVRVKYFLNSKHSVNQKVLVKTIDQQSTNMNTPSVQPILKLILVCFLGLARLEVTVKRPQENSLHLGFTPKQTNQNNKWALEGVAEIQPNCTP